MLGFERKARLFCDHKYSKFVIHPRDNRWDLSVRLGYFVTKQAFLAASMHCSYCWDLSVRLGYFVTLHPSDF